MPAAHWGGWHHSLLRLSRMAVQMAVRMAFVVPVRMAVQVAVRMAMGSCRGRWLLAGLMAQLALLSPDWPCLPGSPEEPGRCVWTHQG